MSDTKATTKEIRRASQDREEEKKRCQPVNHTRLYVPHEKIKSPKTCRVESFGNWRISLDRPIDFILMNVEQVTCFPSGGFTVSAGGCNEPTGRKAGKLYLCAILVIFLNSSSNSFLED